MYAGPLNSPQLCHAHFVKLPCAQELRLAALPSAASGAARAWHIVGCSAISSEGLLDGFDWLVKDVGSRLYLLN